MIKQVTGRWGKAGVKGRPCAGQVVNLNTSQGANLTSAAMAAVELATRAVDAALRSADLVTAKANISQEASARTPLPLLPTSVASARRRLGTRGWGRAGGALKLPCLAHAAAEPCNEIEMPMPPI